MFMVRDLGKYTTFDKVRKVSVMSVTVEFNLEVGYKHTNQTGWCIGNAVESVPEVSGTRCREVLCFSLLLCNCHYYFF